MHPYFMKQKRLLFDGAFGTYYASLYGNEEPCEMANVKAPTRVAAIHEEYLKAGANAIKTNTFAMNEAVLDCSKAKREELLRQGARLSYCQARSNPLSGICLCGYRSLCRDENAQCFYAI